MGFRVAYSGQAIIPYSGTTWIIADNESMDWTLDRYPETGDWELVAYNEDVYPHTVYLRFHVSDVANLTLPVVQPIEIEEIAEAEED